MNSIALLWMSSTINAISVDCPNVIQLARGLGMQTARSAIWTALQSDCCTANDVTCDGNQRVIEIDWQSYGLNSIINGTAIPSSVTHLDLRNNAITGSIPNALPGGLISLQNLKCFEYHNYSMCYQLIEKQLGLKKPYIHTNKRIYFYCSYFYCNVLNESTKIRTKLNNELQAILAPFASSFSVRYFQSNAKFKPYCLQS